MDDYDKLISQAVFESYEEALKSKDKEIDKLLALLKRLAGYITPASSKNTGAPYFIDTGSWFDVLNELSYHPEYWLKGYRSLKRAEKKKERNHYEEL